MAQLPSGLPDIVGDEKNLTRFLSQSSQFNSLMAKPAAFLPNPKYRNTSVFRIGNEPDRIRQTWQKNAIEGRTLKAVAICRCADIKFVGLCATAEEPPDAHANIEGWPWLENDPAAQKAKQIELAQAIVQKCELIFL